MKPAKLPASPKWKIRVFVKVGSYEKNVSWTLGSYDEGAEIVGKIMSEGKIDLKKADGNIEAFQVNKFELFQID